MRQLLAMHTGAVEQRWDEVAWLCSVWVNSQRSTNEDPVHHPKEFQPLRLAEAAAADAAGKQPSGRRGGGLPLDVETVRAYHAALVAQERQRGGKR